MPGSVYRAGAVGNALPRQAIAGGANAAGLLDLTANGVSAGVGDMEGQLTCKLVVGATPLAAPVQFAAYKVYGPPVTLVSASGAQVGLPPGADVDPGQKVFLRSQSGQGEVAVVQSVAANVATLAAAPTFSYAAGDSLYAINATTGSQFAPLGPWPANSVAYAPVIYLGPAVYCVCATNTGSVTAVAVATCDFVSEYR